MAAIPSSSYLPSGSALLSYLGLPEDYQPSPDREPVQFLSRHLRQLPPHLLLSFSAATTPKQRTVIPIIRNRRLRYTESNPHELSLSQAKSTWPALWPGRERPGQEEGREERDWVEREFLGSLKPHVGKLGMLLGGYEEERESERIRDVRRRQAEYIESLPEEDEESDDEEEQESVVQEDNPEETQTLFLRSIRERFIYGSLESMDYNMVDWDERWDAENDRDAEERWFDDEEEECTAVPLT